MNSCGNGGYDGSSSSSNRGGDENYDINAHIALQCPEPVLVILLMIP